MNIHTYLEKRASKRIPPFNEYLAESLIKKLYPAFGAGSVGMMEGAVGASLLPIRTLKAAYSPSQLKRALKLLQNAYIIKFIDPF